MLTIRRATRDDLLAFYGDEARAVTTTAWLGEADGKVLGIGGLRHQGGRVWAFCDLREGAEAYPVALHKLALRTMAHVREHGPKYIYADMDTALETAPRWLERLGFVRLTAGDESTVIWQWHSAE